MPKALIVGIDPGTTVGYALLDFKGNFIAVGSQKELNLSSLILKILDYGSVKIVATDKRKVPSFVYNFAVKTGAKIFKPKEDMKVFLKKDLVKRKVRNDHERDALASALFAFKHYRLTFDKVDKFLQNKGKEKFSDYFKIKILKKDSGLESIYKDLFNEKKKVVKKKRKKTKTGIIVKDNELELLRLQNLKLKEDLSVLANKFDALEQEFDFKIDEKTTKLTKHTKDRLNQLRFDVEELKKEVYRLNGVVEKYKKYLMLNDYFFVPKIKDLGWKNVKGKKKIIFAIDINSFSEKSLEYIRQNIILVIYRGKLNQNFKRGSISFINIKDLKIKEEEDFILVEKESFEKARKKINILDKVLKNYKENS